MTIDKSGKLSSLKVDTTGISAVTNEDIYYLFGVKYEYEGRIYEFEIWALDYPDALMRVEAIRSSARYNGQIIEKIQNNTGERNDNQQNK